jgi:WD40 repeat protein/tetratricopeptide (TPR) repeat protein
MLWNRASKKDVVPETVHEIVKNVGVSTSIVALSEGGGRLAISSDKQVFLCDAKSSEIPPAVIQVGQFIRSTEFSPNEEHLLISSQEIAFYGKDTGALEPGFAGVWDIKDTESITQLCNPIRHDGRVTSLKWNPSLGLIISGSRDGIVQSRFEFFNNSPFPPIIHGGEVRFASLTEDGRILVTASSDGLVRIWQLDRTASNKPLGITSLESKHYLSEMSGKLPWAKPNDIQPVAQSWDDLSESYEPLARSPDDKWLVTRSRRSSQEQLNAGDRVESELFSIQLWDVTRMEKLEKVIPTELPIDRAEFSADSKMIALVSGEHPAWDPQRGDLVTTPRNSLSKPGALIVSDIDGSRISTIDPRGSIGAITFLSNGTKILVGGSDWTGKKGQISIIETKTGRVIGETIRFDSPVINLCFDSAKTKCIAHLENQSCHPFAVTTNGLKSIMEFPVAPVQRTAISGNGALAALGLINGEVYVFSITNEKTSVLVSPVWGIKEDGFLQSPIKSLHFIDEQDVILVAKENGAIEFRDAITGVVKASELVNKNIHQVFISKDNLRILVVGKDLVTQLFETTTQIPITHRIGFQKVETTDLTSCRVLPSSDFSSILIYDKDIGVNHFSQPFSRLEINEIDVLANLITLDRKTIFKSDKNVPSQADDPLKDKYGVSLNSILGFLKKNPESTMAYLIVAKAMNDAGQFENTLSSIEKFLETKSVGCDDIALELRSKAYESLGEKSLAVADQVQLAKIYVERKEVSAAVKDLTKILPNDPLIAIELLESIRSRVELDKKNNRFSGKELSVVKFDIAWIGFIANMRLGNWKEAIHESDILLTLSMYKQLIAVSSVLGIQLDAVVSRMYELSGDRKEFESRCEAMLSSVNKENGILFQEELANLCVDNPKAISDLSVLLNAMQAHRGDNRENVEFLGLLGGIEFRCGRVSDSISTLSTALELVRKVPPRNLRKITEARLMLLLALACHALGNAGDAIRWQELAEPVYQVEMKGPEKELLQLNKPTLSRLHQELHDLTSAYRRVQ